MPCQMLKALLVSASLGALLGLERQWSGERENPTADTIAGARTFAIWGALGTLCAWFARAPRGFFSPVLPAWSFCFALSLPPRAPTATSA